MNVTKEMITAGHKAVMERGEVILSADLLRRIYWSMDSVANQGETSSSPLTDEQIEIQWQFLHDEEGNPPDHHDFARAIERAHRIGGAA